MSHFLDLDDSFKDNIISTESVCYLKFMKAHRHSSKLFSSSQTTKTAASS